MQLGARCIVCWVRVKQAIEKILALFRSTSGNSSMSLLKVLIICFSAMKCMMMSFSLPRGCEYHKGQTDLETWLTGGIVTVKLLKWSSSLPELVVCELVVITVVKQLGPSFEGTSTITRSRSLILIEALQANFSNPSRTTERRAWIWELACYPFEEGISLAQISFWLSRCHQRIK